MPALTPKVVKRRIKSIANTRKITKAMELVSAAKMRRAVSSTVATRPFARLSWEMISAIAKRHPNLEHPLLSENAEAEKTLLVLFTADRGLAGGFNANILRALAKYESDTPLEAIAIGRRGADALVRRGIPVLSRFEGFTNKPKFTDLLPIGRDIIENYKKGTYRKVVIAYTDYVSGLIQKPRIYTLLPFSKPDIVEDQTEGEGMILKESLFEPSSTAVLERTLPRLIETMLYQALLESAASEHSARMVAMKSASDAAKDMLGDLKFTYNQIRQAGITREIAEISSGAAAIAS